MDLKCTGYYRGKPCRKLLGKANGTDAVIEIYCPRCTKKNKYELEQ